MQQVSIKYEKDAFEVEIGSSDSVGYDLKTPTDLNLPGGMVTKVGLGLSLDMSNDLWGQIMGRSSMEKLGIHVVGGVIDPDYKGELSVLLYNSNESTFIVRGQRIAQLVFHARIMPIKANCILKERGQGGFGSSGK